MASSGNSTMENSEQMKQYSDLELVLDEEKPVISH